MWFLDRWLQQDQWHVIHLYRRKTDMSGNPIIGTVMARKVFGKWQYRVLTEQELKDWEDQCAW